MKENLASYDPVADVDSAWDEKPALYTDLNSPVLVPDPVDASAAKPVFPIIDPRAMSNSATTRVQGFSYKNNGIHGVVDPGSAGTANDQRLPMPAEWLYVLKDGSITAPSSLNGKAAVFSGNNIPTRSNPIVGRIAFWTDDETSKVNINTAAGDLANIEANAAGSFWDVPKVDSPQDQALATNQPFQYEFQRYPGHPATISLSAIFPTLTRQNIASTVPRIVGGGSDGGTVTTTSTTLPALVPDADRLYSSVDELLFAAPPYASGSVRPNNPVIDHDQLEKARFFLTASSRAPDLNLFGQPRVAIWPLSAYDDASHRTGTDRLIAFCATAGGKPYYFTRKNPNSVSEDYSGSARNQSLYAYLQEHTSKAVPGFASHANGFAGKLGSALERDQILTEIFDYIRITNLNDPNVVSPYAATLSGTNYMPGSGQVLPIEISASNGPTRGFGRFHMISEAALLFYASEVEGDTTKTTKKLSVALLLERFNIAGGYMPLYPNYEYRLAGLTDNPIKLTVNGSEVTLSFPNGPTNNICNNYTVNSLTMQGGVEGVAGDFVKVNASGASYVSSIYPFNSDPVTVPAGCTSITLEDSTLNLEIVAYGNVIQRIPLRFLKTTLPVPQPPPTPYLSGIAYDGGSLTNFNNRMSLYRGKYQNYYASLITSADVVRSLELGGATKGDVRLLFRKFSAGSVPTEYFDTHALYDTGVDTMRAHSLELGLQYEVYLDGSLGALINADYKNSAIPAVPSTKQGSYQALTGTPGDWDTGIGRGSDGPMINKADDGTTTSSASGWVPYFGWTDTSMDRSMQGKSLSSPNRQIASAVQFGSLSTGVIRQLPWQTLLFRPDPDQSHPGSTAPKDHLLLDLFTMPVVEPYAISEPFSTAGRVNMNYRIAPYGGYITRSTAMRAALQSTMLMAIPSSLVKIYKRHAGTTANCRYSIEPDEETGTLKYFEDRFNRNDSLDTARRGLFVSASEICDVPLVPKGSSVSTLNSFWTGKELTGDNVREMPYSRLYPLLTTKSNTYTIHVRVQALKKVPSTDPAQWVEGKDTIVGEYRGSSIIERYIDPADPRLTQGNADYRDPDSNSLEPLYRFRVVGTKRFSP